MQNPARPELDGAISPEGRPSAPKPAPASASRRPSPPLKRQRGTFYCKSCHTERPVGEQSVAFGGRCTSCVRGRLPDRSENAAIGEQTPLGLKKRIERRLIAQPGQTVQELHGYLRGARITEATVSSVLAAHPDVFVSDNADPPRWSTAHWRPNRRVEATGLPTASPALYRWQQEALVAWRAHGCRGLIEAVTGTGKTRLGVEAAREELGAGGKVLVVVPSRELLSQWHTTLRSAFRGYRIDRLGDGYQGNLTQSDLLVATVHTAKNYKHLRSGQRGLLVADECHRYGAGTFQLVLDQAFPHRLGLTATYERSDGGHLTYLHPYFGGPPIFSLGYQRAIADDIAAHFKLALIGVQFTSSEQHRYLEADEALREAGALLIHHGAPEEPYGEFMRAVAEFAEGPPSPPRTAALRYLAAFSHRRQVLADSTEKLTLLTHLGNAINAATGSLIFTMTTQSADSIAAALQQQGVRTKALHSGLRPTQRKDVLQRFARQDLKALVAPMVLDEGVDVPQADLAIIVAASRTRRQMIQRMGRVLRKKTDGRLARIAVMYVAGSFEDPRRGAHEAFLDTVRDVSDDQRDFRTGTSPRLIIDYLSDHRPVPTMGHRIFVDRVLGWNASCSCGWTPGLRQSRGMRQMSEYPCRRNLPSNLAM